MFINGGKRPSHSKPDCYDVTKKSQVNTIINMIITASTGDFAQNIQHASWGDLKQRLGIRDGFDDFFRVPRGPRLHRGQCRQGIAYVDLNGVGSPL